MKLSEYPIGVLSFFAGLDGDGRVIKSNQLIPHNHDGEYAQLDHNHDTVYSGVNHNHDTTYSAIDHNHDGDYAPFLRRVRMGSASWAGGQTLPYRVLVSTEPWTYQNAPILWGLIMRDDGYLYYFQVDEFVVYNVAAHTPFSYSITREVEGDNTYIVIPVGATALNVSGRGYQGFVIGIGGY